MSANVKSAGAVQDAALAFCEEHDLDLGIAAPLARHIQGSLDQAHREVLAQVLQH